jgi:two-component system sensor histidine kinase TctE
VRDVLATVDDGVSAMTRVTNQLLTLGRVEHERARPAAAAVDLRQLLRGVIAENAPRALDAGVELVLDVDTPCVVAANELLIREMVLNLVDNAIKYAGPGATVTVSAAQAGEMARLKVEDTGPGISGEEHARLLRRFSRGRAAGGGSGLGLTIVAEIAEMSGGRVEFPDPQQGRGFVFAVTLPLWRADQRAVSTNSVV